MQCRSASKSCKIGNGRIKKKFNLHILSVHLLSAFFVKIDKLNFYEIYKNMLIFNKKNTLIFKNIRYSHLLTN